MDKMKNTILSAKNTILCAVITILIYCFDNVKLYTFCKSCWVVFYKVKHMLTNNFIPGIYSSEITTYVHTKNSHKYIYRNIIYNHENKNI